MQHSEIRHGRFFFFFFWPNNIKKQDDILPGAKCSWDTESMSVWTLLRIKTKAKISFLKDYFPLQVLRKACASDTRKVIQTRDIGRCEKKG